MVRFQLLYNEESLLKEQQLFKCETVLDIKKLVLLGWGHDPNAQMISFEGALLVDSFKLSQIAQPPQPQTGEPRPNMPQESMTTLVLTLAQGKCILDINLFLSNTSHQLELIIPSSITVESLQTLIIHTVQRLELP